MRVLSFHILRIGLAITFLWIGILIFRDPEAWGSYLQPWAAQVLPIPLVQAMIGTAILDMLIGIFLLFDIFTWIAALFAAVHLVIVLMTTGVTDITVRDMGLFAAAVSLFLAALPHGFLKRNN